MNKKFIIAISVATLLVVGASSIAGMYFSYNRQEVKQRNACEAQFGNIENVLDNMWKNFQEIGGIADRERETAMELFREYAEARTVKGQGQMMAWITEQVPDISPEMYKDLQARVTAGRQEYRQSQTYMLELIRVHTDTIEDPFKSMFITNIEPFEFTVISSDETKAAVKSGVDNRVFELPNTK